MIRVGTGEAYTKIQDGIDAAAVGDTVLVTDGAYTGAKNVNLQIMGKSITVKSENGPESCIIDCQHAPDTCGFYIQDVNSGNSCSIEGFTIKDGGKVITSDGPRNVGGICSVHSSVILVNNIITGHNGAGIYSWDSQVTISHNEISDNNDHGIFGELLLGTLEYNRIARNSGDGIRVYEDYCSLNNNVIVFNAGYGFKGMGLREITKLNGDTILYNDNGVYFSVSPSGIGDMEIKNTILWNNSPHEIYCTGGYDEAAPPTVPVSYSDIKGGKCGVFSDMYSMGILTTPLNPVDWLEGNNKIRVNVVTSAVENS